jgi:hypothetical protein
MMISFAELRERELSEIWLTYLFKSNTAGILETLKKRIWIRLGEVISFGYDSVSLDKPLAKEINLDDKRARQSVLPNLEVELQRKLLETGEDGAARLK